MADWTSFELADVAKILEMPKSKVTNWTIGRPFTFHATFQSGEGKGTRNHYSIDDIIRMALANELRNVGLSTKEIGMVFKLFGKERGKIRRIRMLGSPYLEPGATNWLTIELKANEISVRYLIRDDPPSITMPDEKNVAVGNYIINLTALVNRIQTRINKLGKGISWVPVHEETVDEVNK